MPINRFGSTKKEEERHIFAEQHQDEQFFDNIHWNWLTVIILSMDYSAQKYLKVLNKGERKLTQFVSDSNLNPAMAEWNPLRSCRT